MKVSLKYCHTVSDRGQGRRPALELREASGVRRLCRRFLGCAEGATSESAGKAGALHTLRGRDDHSVCLELADSVGGRSGVALVITLIMLSVITFMAIAFLVLTRSHKSTVTAQTDQTIARLAADNAFERAQVELLAPVLAATNQFNFGLLVSTNYINLAGFNPGVSSPTNVNFDYVYRTVTPLNPAQQLQNLTNLLFSPRVPVWMTNRTFRSNEFRYYLDLNRNARFDSTGWQVMTNQLGQPIINGTNGSVLDYIIGDPQWIGGLQYPDRNHSADNPFLYRYAYAVVPISQALDINYMHNYAKALDPLLNYGSGDGFLRNQGVGSWEINLGAFLADLNTNYWDTRFSPYTYNGGPAGSPTDYTRQNRGFAFDDALSVLRYRYFGRRGNQASVRNLFGLPGANAVGRDFMDDYSAGPPMIGTSWSGFGDADNPRVTTAWAGADNTNHFFTIQDLFDRTKTGFGLPPGAITLSDRLIMASTNVSTYDRETYYRLLSQLGTDSAPEDPGKINLNYDNLVQRNVLGIASATNFIPWRPVDFFTNAAKKLLANAGYNPNLVNIDNLQVYPTNYYTPSVHRLLQLAANIYDAATNRTFNVAGATNGFPSVFRPIFRRFRAPGYSNEVVAIVGYREVVGTALANQATAPTILELGGKDPISSVPTAAQWGTDRQEPLVSGVPLVVGARKGIPNFNEFSMQTGLFVSRLLEFRRAPGDDNGPITLTNQMYVVGISNIFGLEAWNSYSNPYPRNLRLIASATMTAIITNEVNNTIVLSNRVVRGVLTNLTAGNWRGWANGSAGQNSFVLPWGGGNLFMYLTNSTYVNHIPWFEPQTHLFRDSQLGGFYAPHWWLNLNTRLQFILVDTVANRIVDYVNLNNWEPTLDISAKLAEGADCTGNPSVLKQPSQVGSAQWCTNRLHNSANPLVPTMGIINQIGVGLGFAGDNPDPTSFTRDPYAGLDADSAIDGFRNNLGLSPVYNTGKIFSRSNVFYAPFDPYRPIYVHTTWQANDPLVHYTIGDLVDLSSDPSNRVDIVSHNPALDSMGVINKRYQPWGGNPGATDRTLDFQVAVKDPYVTRPDDWDFPTNKYPNIGWLGRVHRGTPWQTIFLKSTNVLQQTLDIRQNFQAWQKWVGDAITIPTNIGMISSSYLSTNNPLYNGFLVADAAFSVPTNDWHILDLFTTAINDNASRGRLSVNQTNLAAWSAVLSGVNVLQDTNPANSLVIEPAGVYNPANPPPLVRIVNGINNARTNFFNQSFQRLGDILAAPELTVASPYLSTNRNAILSDAVVERIPQQILGLLQGPQKPRFLIYSYGQTLKPAPRSIVTSGAYFGLCTNYQVTAEVATRAVVRIDGAPTNTHAVVESFNVLPPD